MSTAKPTKSGFTIIDEGSLQEAQIVMNDGDRFFVTYAEAAHACRVAERMKDFIPQMTQVLNRLKDWSKERLDRISSACLSPGEHGLLFLVMQKEVPFDQTLSDDLVDLDIEIAQNSQFSLIRLEVLAIPHVSKETATAFMSSGPFHDYAE